MIQRLEYIYSDIHPFLGLEHKLQRYFVYFKVKLLIADITIALISSFLFLILIDSGEALKAMRYDLFKGNPVLLVLSGSLFAVLGTWLCARFASTAEGSGIPELKTVFSGTNFYNFLSMQTLWVKYFSSLFVKLAGIGMGYEGSFVHIQAIMGHNLLKLPFFKDIASDHNEKIIISTGVCSAMVMFMGAPIGALFFTIEMYTSNFKVTNLMRSFTSMTISYTMYLVLQHVFTSAIERPVIKREFFFTELHCFVILGVLLGLFSALFMAGFSKYLSWKRNQTHFLFANRYVYAFWFTLVIGALATPHGFFKFGYREVLNDLINKEDLLGSGGFIRFWYNDGRVVYELLYLMAVRILMFVALTTCAIPFGLLGPGIIIGTIFGRLFGECLELYFGITTAATVFSVSAASGFICAVTRSFSPLIRVMEITGELQLFFPMLLTVTIAYAVSSVFSIGFYDMIISIRKLPYLASILPPDKAAMTAADIMSSIGADRLNEASSLFEVMELVRVKEQIFDFDYVPIVSARNKKITKFVQLRMCWEFLKYFEVRIEEVLLANKDSMSNRLSLFVQALFRENNQYSSQIISKHIRSHLKHIQYKDGKFVMNSMARNNAEEAQRMQHERRTVSKNARLTKRRSTVRFTSAFARDTFGQEQEKKEEVESDFLLLKELLQKVPVDFNNPAFNAETFPVLVHEDTTLIKVHYLFLMLICFDFRPSSTGLFVAVAMILVLSLGPVMVCFWPARSTGRHVD